MCIASKQAGPELASATRCAQSMLTTKKRGEAEQEPSLCSKNQPPDSSRLPLDVPRQAVNPVVSCRTRFRTATVVAGAMAALQSDSADGTAATATQQLRKLVRQRMSDQRVARRHHNETLQSIALLNLTLKQLVGSGAGAGVTPSRSTSALT
ncbi:hypothetical protein PI126_g15390 [Phytophthora idaei]|nr:hypothetical protein PI126_g15390 [Phytophthora idaei]